MTRFGDGEWTNDGIGDANRFDTEAEAQDGIAQLRQLGEEWANAEYRVRPVAIESTHGLTTAGEALATALTLEAGESPDTEAFVANHHPDDINAAASGDTAALIALRQACGLPIFS